MMSELRKNIIFVSNVKIVPTPPQPIPIQAPILPRLGDQVTPTVTVRERIRRIEARGSPAIRIKLFTGSTRDARSDEYWSNQIQDPALGTLKT